MGNESSIFLPGAKTNSRCGRFLVILLLVHYIVFFSTKGFGPSPIRLMAFMAIGSCFVFAILFAEFWLINKFSAWQGQRDLSNLEKLKNDPLYLPVSVVVRPLGRVEMITLFLIGWCRRISTDSSGKKYTLVYSADSQAPQQEFSANLYRLHSGLFSFLRHNEYAVIPKAHLPASGDATEAA